MRQANDKPNTFVALHWWRLKRSLGRRWREWRLPAGYETLVGERGVVLRLGRMLAVPRLS